MCGAATKCLEKRRFVIAGRVPTCATEDVAIGAIDGSTREPAWRTLTCMRAWRRTAVRLGVAMAVVSGLFAAAACTSGIAPASGEGGVVVVEEEPEASTPATPQVTAVVTLSGAAGCSGDVFTAGNFGGATPVRNGESQGGGTASVTCVVAGDSSFAVSGKVTLGDGTSLTIGGTLRTASPPGSVSAMLSKGQSSFTRTACTATYPTSGGIARGRVWADLECAATGTGVPGSCAATVKVKFENCTQR